MVKKVYVKVPASTGNMGSGFDCAGLSLKLYNGFIVERAKETGIEFTKYPEGASPSEVLVLFLKAFKSAMDYVNEKPFPVKVKVENDIPFRKGFGSSATVILAGVISALLLTGKKVKKEEVLKIALPVEGHIDNLAASLYGGFVIGKVETLTVVSVAPPKSLSVVAFIPEEGLSTKIARKVLPSFIPFSDAVYNISSFGFLCATFFLKRIDLLKDGLEDKLHQPYRAKMIPHLKGLIFDRKPGVILGGCLSGAGPSIVFFAERKDGKRALLEIEDTIRKKKIKGRISLLEPGGKTSWKVVK